MKWGRRFRRRLRNALRGFRRPDGVFLPQRYEPRWNDQRVRSEWDSHVNFQSKQDVLVVTVPVNHEFIKHGDHAGANIVVQEAMLAARQAVRERFALA